MVVLLLSWVWGCGFIMDFPNWFHACLSPPVLLCPAASPAFPFNPPVSCSAF